MDEHISKDRTSLDAGQFVFLHDKLRTKQTYLYGINDTSHPSSPMECTGLHEMRTSRWSATKIYAVPATLGSRLGVDS